jgi:ATP-dependent DNA ligase
MAGRIERGLLTRTGLDWSAKYPSALMALAAVRAKTAYLDGELCGVGEDGLPNFAETQAATDGSRGVRLVFYAFDLLHLDGRDTAALPLFERKALLEPIVAVFRACNSMVMRLATASLSAAMPASSLRGHCIEDGRRALRVGQSRPLAQSEMPQPAGIRRCRMD